MKDELTRRIDALFHRGLKWQLASELRAGNDEQLVAKLEACIDENLREMNRLDPPTGGSILVEACEYCNREDGVLYGWHADTWCRECIEKYPLLKMTGSLDDAPLGPDSLAAGDHSTPFIIQVGP